jgi:acyl transferase domain-containing protein
MAGCHPGSMLAVDRLGPFGDLIDGGTVVVAATNSPTQFVLSGDRNGVDIAVARAADAGVPHHRLATSHAFHSPLMRDAADEFATVLRSCRLHTPRISVVSNVTGSVLTEFEARNPLYWAEHLLRPVDFSGSVATLRGLGVTRYIEVGPGRSMSNLLRANFGPDAAAILQLASALAEPANEEEAFADALSLGWSADSAVRIDGYAEAVRMTVVPTYAFERRVHWIEPVTAGHPRESEPRVRPEPSVVAPAADSTPAQTPGGAAQEAVATIRQVVEQIFESVLGIDRPAGDQGFFDLGGNSLMAIQLINQLRESFEIDLSVRDFYENSSIDGATAVITTLLVEEQDNG